MYTSELSIYHTSYLFIQRIALFRSSFIDASCALVFNFVISFSYSKITLQISRFQFDSSFLYIHLMLKFHTQNRDFNWSTRIVNFIHNLVHKFEISIGRREQSNLHHFNEFLHTGCSILQYQNIRVSNTHVCIQHTVKTRVRCGVYIFLYRNTYSTGI